MKRQSQISQSHDFQGLEDIEKEPLFHLSNTGKSFGCVCGEEAERREGKDEEHRASHSGLGANGHASPSVVPCYGS